MKFVTAGKLKQVSSLGCIYGEPGTGKTSCVRGLPPDETLIVDLDGGGARVLPPEYKVMIPDSTGDIGNLLEAMLEGKHEQFRYIVLDTISTYILKLLFERHKARVGTKSLASFGKHMDEFLQRQDYAQTNEMAYRILNLAHELSKSGRHVIMIAHDMMTEWGPDKTLYHVPQLIRVPSGDTKSAFQTLNMVLGWFDWIGWLKQGTSTRMIFFERNVKVRDKVIEAKFVCKRRTHEFPYLESNGEYIDIGRLYGLEKSGEEG